MYSLSYPMAVHEHIQRNCSVLPVSGVSECVPLPREEAGAKCLDEEPSSGFMGEKRIAQ